MKRKAFILTELLTGMTLQSMFALTLCGAFYMLLSFSTSTQQILAAHDEGQMVISYVDTRIRNAGIGMWDCGNHSGVAKAFNKIPAIKNLELPVAIISTDNKVDSSDGIYKGNVLTLLYARKDHNSYSYSSKNTRVKMIVVTDNMKQDSVDVITLSSNKYHFNLLDGYLEGEKEFFASSFSKDGMYTDIHCYAVMESSGRPVYLSQRKGTVQKSLRISAPERSGYNVNIYPMSELLNLECERLFCDMSTGENSLMIQNLSDAGTWDTKTPHTKGILDIYMELDTNPTVPIFTLNVLVSEGLHSGDDRTERPNDWPGVWNDNFSKHKVHISRASWRLYNLAPLF